MPGAEVVAEAIGVSPFLDVIHLLEDRGVKLAQHAFPVGILVCLRKEAIHQLYDLVENGYVERNDLLKIRALNLNGNFLTGCQARAVDLAQRSGSNRLAVDFRITFRQAAAELGFDASKSFRR